MTSLVFRALDLKVVGGKADSIAVRMAGGTRSYAQLLHETACLASGMRQVGVSAGTDVVIDLPRDLELVVAVLACARLGAVPRDAGSFRFAADPVVFHTPDTEVPWDVLIRAGRTDPEPAPADDPHGYADLLRAAHGDVFATLLDSDTLT